MKQQLNELTIISPEKCTGCQACRQICPHNAIDIIEDEEGFLFPIKNANCTNCKLCINICPIINDVKRNENLKESIVYLFRHNDENVIEKSSSGGAFTAIVQDFYDDNCVIFGAEYSDGFKVIHSYVQDINDLDKFRKSKYVQSDVKNTYVEAKNFLISGKKVIYTGTPCQIAGLKNYLGRDYSNLLCIDLICHGAPSYKVFRKYLEFLHKKYNSKVKEITFRKRTTEQEKWNSRNISILFCNNKCIIQNSLENEYLNAYHRALNYRKSCSNCKFASVERNSDITIADCWGIENLYKDIDVHKGYSMVIINTQKGNELFDKIKKHQEVKPLSIDFAISSNAQFSQPAKFHKNRKMFFENLDKLQFDKLVNKCLRKELIKAKIKKAVPKSFKRILKSFLRRK